MTAENSSRPFAIATGRCMPASGALCPHEKPA
jgi:hypothetical protein